MAITLRLSKGTALTHSELDANFSTLDTSGDSNRTHMITRTQALSDSDRAHMVTRTNTIDGNIPRQLNALAGDSDIDFGTNKILYSNHYDSTGAFPSAVTYHGMFAHAHNTGKGYMAHGGAWVKLHSDGDSMGELANGIMVNDAAIADGKFLKYDVATDRHVYDSAASSVSTLSDVNISGIQNNSILKYSTATSKWIIATDQTAGGGSGIALTDLSVSTNAAGSAALTYNNSTGVFSYTPPLLTSYLDSAAFHTKLTTNYSLSAFDSATFHTKLTTNYASDFKGAGFDSASFHTKLTTNYASDFKGAAFDSATFHTKLTGNYTLGGGGGGGSGAYDLNGGELTLDADADTTIHADTDDEIDFKVGGSDVATLKADGLYVDAVKSLSAGTPTVTSSSNIVLSTGGSVTVTQNSGGGGFRVGSLTTTNRGALSAADGEIIYNSTNGMFEIYQRGAWQPMTKGAAVFNVTNNGATDYTFSDAENHWFPTSTNDPVLYLRRGETYYFVVNASSHPFEIRQSNGGSAYTVGVTNNATQVGTVTFKVPMSAPATLYYQCTAHSGMGNTINIV